MGKNWFVHYLRPYSPIPTKKNLQCQRSHCTYEILRGNCPPFLILFSQNDFSDFKKDTLLCVVEHFVCFSKSFYNFFFPLKLPPIFAKHKNTNSVFRPVFYFKKKLINKKKSFFFIFYFFKYTWTWTLTVVRRY